MCLRKKSKENLLFAWAGVFYNAIWLCLSKIVKWLLEYGIYCMNYDQNYTQSV